MENIKGEYQAAYKETVGKAIAVRLTFLCYFITFVIGCYMLETNITMVKVGISFQIMLRGS